MYGGSGTQVAHFMSMFIRPFASKIQLAQAYEVFETALQQAGKANVRYLFFPVITNWEPRNAAWSGRPTRASITVTAYDVAANQQLFVRKIDIEGRSVTLISQSVDKLVETAIKEFCENLF